MTSVATQPERQIESFMPASDVRTCDEIIVHAPANVVFDTAEHLDLLSIPLVRAIFWLRGKIMGAAPTPPRRATALVAETKSLGWGQLARRPGRELVMGAVTQPWKADVTFTPIPPDAFLTYAEPDRVKIVWTLEAVPIEPTLTLFRTETRVQATDAAAREKFLRYWLVAKIGIFMIRWLHLPALRKAAERQS
ncbi:MAG TPA: hypothetical protein VGU74_05430 [Gemmatimonadales bacterium]|nr:hypothetical protein [Gemmatimonadales bacterium]